MQKTKTLITLCACADWFETSLYAHAKLYFVLVTGSIGLFMVRLETSIYKDPITTVIRGGEKYETIIYVIDHSSTSYVMCMSIQYTGKTMADKEGIA